MGGERSDRNRINMGINSEEGGIWPVNISRPQRQTYSPFSSSSAFHPSFTVSTFSRRWSGSASIPQRVSAGREGAPRSMRRRWRGASGMEGRLARSVETSTGAAAADSVQAVGRPMKLADSKSNENYRFRAPATSGHEHKKTGHGRRPGRKHRRCDRRIEDARRSCVSLIRVLNCLIGLLQSVTSVVPSPHSLLPSPHRVS